MVAFVELEELGGLLGIVLFLSPAVVEFVAFVELEEFGGNLGEGTSLSLLATS